MIDPLSYRGFFTTLQGVSCDWSSLRSRESSLCDWLSRVEAEVVAVTKPRSDLKEKQAATQKIKDLSHAVDEFQVGMGRCPFHSGPE